MQQKARMLWVGLMVCFLCAINTSITKADTYNKWDAVVYAYYYCSADCWSYPEVDYDNSWYSPYYDSFDNDCTNFVSQCLSAGGWNNTGLDPYDDFNWFHYWNGRGGHSHSFSKAENLFDFLWFSGRGNLVSYWDELEPGDVVQVNWDGGWPVSHTMIVTYKDDWGGIYLTQHSQNRLNKPVWAYYSEFPNAAFYGWHLNTEYYW